MGNILVRGPEKGDKVPQTSEPKIGQEASLELLAKAYSRNRNGFPYGYGQTLYGLLAIYA